MKQEIKQKFYFDVKVECMLPATLTYRVLADDAEQAANMIKNLSPNGVKYKVPGKKDIKLTVYQSGTNIIKFLKSFFGG